MQTKCTPIRDYSASSFVHSESGSFELLFVNHGTLPCEARTRFVFVRGERNKYPQMDIGVTFLTADMKYHGPELISGLIRSDNDADINSQRPAGIISDRISTRKYIRIPANIRSDQISRRGRECTVRSPKHARRLKRPKNYDVSSGGQRSGQRT